MPTTTNRRVGRLPAAARAGREVEILDAARAVLVEIGYERLTVQAIATRAGASKETIYSWFGGVEQLLARVVEANADAAAAAVSDVLAADAAPTPTSARATLTGYVRAQLTLLTGAESVALNRAAMASSSLAEVLLAGGRHRVGPIVESYLARLGAAGVLRVSDPADAFRLLYGLAVQDTQIRVLLGEDRPTPAQIGATAESAVERFLVLTST
ncbi:TetR/AcrR family transcriptional regulator [Georgenia sp. Z1344]|uniref:TetR/AcrR family transcriptional regulator n=1 Tax=Georgenia sp. Z1344 TaxID=3416706 RepID=UPI003CEEA947